MGCLHVSLQIFKNILYHCRVCEHQYSTESLLVLARMLMLGATALIGPRWVAANSIRLASVFFGLWPSLHSRIMWPSLSQFTCIETPSAVNLYQFGCLPGLCRPVDLEYLGSCCEQSLLTCFVMPVIWQFMLSTSFLRLAVSALSLTVMTPTSMGSSVRVHGYSSPTPPRALRFSCTTPPGQWPLWNHQASLLSSVVPPTSGPSTPAEKHLS